MNVRAVQTFLAIVRTGSFVAAADELNSTLSTVSMQIRGLEKTLGLALFDREFRPPRLSPIGQALVEPAQKLVDAERDLLSQCQHSDELSGLYRIGFVATASVRLLPRFISHAKVHADKAEFRFETALSQVLEERVLNGNLEAAVVTASSVSPPALQYSPLAREPLVYAIPKSVDGGNLDTAEKALPFFQFNPGSGIGKSIEAFQRRRATNTAHNPIVLDSVEAIMECVNEGFGFTLLAKPDVERYAGRLVKLVEPVEAKLFRDIVLVTRRNFDDVTRARICDLFDL